MIKIKGKRINTVNIVDYEKESDTTILFHMIDGNNISISFKSTELRDEMIENLDKYLIMWDNGKMTTPDFGMGTSPVVLDLNSLLNDGEAPDGSPLH